MKCVFLDDEEHCHAGMVKESVRWKPDEIAMKAYCKMDRFIKCPRYLSKMNALTSGQLRENESNIT